MRYREVPLFAHRMTHQQMLAFAIVAGMMALFVWGRFRYDLVAALSLLVAVVVGIVPADKAFTGFSDDIVIIVASALLVSAAVSKSGVLEAGFNRIAPYFPDDPDPDRGSGGRGDGALRLREEHRRARDDDLGRLPDRAAHEYLAFELSCPWPSGRCSAAS